MIRKIDIDSELYPQNLKNIQNPPNQIYAIGNMDLLKQEGIAVVGTRRTSPYGRWVAGEIGKVIAKSGYVVISGMAEGIDSCAHKACLDAGGNTIAVFGCGVNVCFPLSNRNLYNSIKEKGLVLSEYDPNEPARSYYFPQRNRIISGLSKSVVVVEGAIKSGSMITANYALNQGKDVFAVPGNINQPNSVGVNMLIRDGATPILSVEEIADTLGIKTYAYEQIKKSCTIDEAKILECIKYSPGICTEEISLKCDLSIQDANIFLSALELKSIIRRDGNYNYLD